MRLASFRRRGMAIITAIFFSMVALFAVTALVVQSRHTSGFNNINTRELQEMYEAKGACQAVIAKMNGDDEDFDWTEYTTESEAYTFGTAEEVVKAWVSQDESFPNILHIHAKSKRQYATKVVTLVGAGESKVFGTAVGPAPTGPQNTKAVRLFAAEQGSGGQMGEWSEVPPPPKEGFDAFGSPITSDDDMNTNFATDFEGNVYAVTGGYNGYGVQKGDGSGAWKLMPPRPKIEPQGGMIQKFPGEFHYVAGGSNGELAASRDGERLYFVENLVPKQGDIPDINASYIVTLDTEATDSSGWTWFRGPTQEGYDANGTPVPFSGPLDENWAAIEELAVGNEGDVYAVTDQSNFNRENRTIQKRTSTGWARLPFVPEAIHGLGSGALRVDSMTAGPEGELYVTTHTGNYEYVISKYADDGNGDKVWTAVSPPEVGGVVRNHLSTVYGVDPLSVDAEGHLVVSDRDPVTNKRTVYRMDDPDTGTWSALDELPMNGSEKCGTHAGGGSKGDDDSVDTSGTVRATAGF